MGGGTGNVIEFPKGSSTDKDLHIALGAAGGVGFDGEGHLLVTDESVPSLNVYAPGERKALHHLSLPGASRYFAFSKDSRVLYVADYDLGEIDVYLYAPNALTQINTITNGNCSVELLGLTAWFYTVRGRANARMSASRITAPMIAQMMLPILKPVTPAWPKSP